MPIKRERIIHVLVSGAILGALFVQSRPALADLAVPYGKDGSPPDSETQAKVDALNDALDGPDGGESLEHWQARLKAAHDALYGSGDGSYSTTVLDTDATDPGGSGVVNGGLVPQPFDLCESHVGDWLSFGEPTSTTDANPVASELVAGALGDPSVLADLETELGNFGFHMMRIEAAGTIVSVARPNGSQISCSKGKSEVTIRIPVGVVELGVSLGSGALTVHGGASYHPHPNSLDDWCFDVKSYDLTGFEPITREMILPRIGQAMSDTPFCLPAFGPAYAVTYSGSS